MSKPIAQVNINLHTFFDWIDITNLVVNTIATEVVTVNSSANGGMTSGNGYVNGIFGATAIVAPTLRGGNVATPGNINVSSNVIFDTGLNLIIGDVTLSGTGIDTPSLTGLSSLSIGNTTANSVITGTSIRTNNFIANVANVNLLNVPKINVGGGWSINSTKLDFGTFIQMSGSEIRIGNSTSNVVINSTSVVVPSLVSSQTITLPELKLGNTSVNVYANSIGIQFGARLTANQTAFTAGNTTFFSHVVQSAVRVVNTVSNTVINPGTVVLSNTTVNFTLKLPTAAQKLAGDYWLNANGDYGLIPVVNTGTSMGSLTTTGTSAQLLNSFELTSLRTLEYIFSIKNNSANGYQAQKLLCLNVDGDLDTVEYGIMMSNGVIGTFTANSNTTHGRLWVTPTAANTTIKYHRIELGV